MKRKTPNLDKLVQVVNLGNYVVMDTETSGLDDKAEIVQFAMIGASGNTLYDSLTKPTNPIPADATKVHGITTEEAMRDGVKWGKLFQNFMGLLVAGEYEIVIYNRDYDVRLVTQTCKAHAVDSAPWLNYILVHPPVCAMLAFAEFNGDWDDYYHSYRWVKLTKACETEQIEVENAHDAAGDCLMTLALCKKLAEISLQKLDQKNTV